MNDITLCHDSVGLYVHVPFCQAKCRYCAFYSEPLGLHNPQPLVDALCMELRQYSPDLAQVSTVYLGGGSPTGLPSHLLGQLLAEISTHCQALEEFTVECNPGQTTPKLLELMQSRQVNRLSFGVQSWDDSELTLLGRNHSADQARQAIKAAQCSGFGNIGVDLIFAIPGSTHDTWRNTLAQTLTLGIQHISTYSLSYEVGTPLSRARKAGHLQAVDEALDRDMYETAIDVLPAAGYPQYEISNFARPDSACRHNLGYWHNHPFIGIGPSAASYWLGCRRTNIASVTDYVAQIQSSHPLQCETAYPDKPEHTCETAVLGLRMLGGLHARDFYRLTGKDLWETFGAVITEHEQMGHLHVSPDQIALTRAALPIADRVLCDFAAL
ncbi:radical SAM family heme chaperone HemW [Planctomycetota bacterium]